MATAHRLINRAHGAYLTLVAEVEARGIADRDHGWSTANTLIEPDPNAPPGSRWEIRLDSRGPPELLPPSRFDPSRFDPTRTPRQHRRFGERDLLAG